MTIKLKLFDKQNGIEIDDKEVIINITNEIRKILHEKFNQYDYYIKSYGEISKLGCD